MKLGSVEHSPQGQRAPDEMTKQRETDNSYSRFYGILAAVQLLSNDVKINLHFVDDGI